MKNMIIISKGKELWEAEYLGPYSNKVFALFGTRIIATPYGHTHSGEWVKKDIAERNPGFEVNLDPRAMDAPWTETER